MRSDLAGFVWVELAVEAFWVDRVHCLDPFVFDFQEVAPCSGLENGDFNVSFEVVAFFL